MAGIGDQKNGIEMKNKYLKLCLYFLRWQLAGIVAYSPFLILFESKILALICGNIFGACIFFYIDRWLTKKH